MKFTTVTVSAALIGFSIGQGQSLEGLPTCAQDCASDAIPESCGVDVKCICSASDFINGVTCCVQGICSQEDQDKTLEYAKQLCAGAGVTEGIDNEADCPSNSSTTAAATSNSSATAAATSAAPSATDNAAVHDMVAHGLSVAGLAVAGAFALV